MIAIYVVTKNMTREQHTKGRDRLREAGAPESAMKLHSCFGEDGQLQVFDVWESQEVFDEFLKYLGPVMDLASSTGLAACTSCLRSNWWRAGPVGNVTTYGAGTDTPSSLMNVYPRIRANQHRD